MTHNNPMQDVYKSILGSYNPLHIKDILIHGASRKAIYHKSEDEIIGFYAKHNEGIHHELLDSKEQWFKLYAFMQYCYNQTNKTQQDQFEFLRDVVWLYIDKVADELGDDYELHDKTRQQVEDEVLQIDLDIRKNQLQVIDGGKS